MPKDSDLQQAITRDEGERPKGPQNAKERLYEKLRMPLWLLDTLLVILCVAVVVLVIVGIIEGRAPQP